MTSVALLGSLLDRALYALARLSFTARFEKNRD